MSATAAIPQEVRNAVSDLLAEYGMALDQDRLEDWATLFTDDCDYRVISRENEEQGLPNVMIWCDNRDMLLDRIESYRHVNEYNLHWDRHVIGLPRHFGQVEGLWQVEASYSAFQTDLEGATRLFSVGRYRMGLRVESGVARIRSVVVVADTGLIPTLLATPL
ncbi:MAG: aromatic-ring-hydroxylating dioxygenase subunit beta [Betaproteobacteria bacterium]|nr:aromatic-ring-hydroxylating dioxygenase subunit beta [Betaproteobacteria bacterium]